MPNDPLENNNAGGVPPEHDPVQEKTEIARVSIKVPPFWATQPQIWFAQIESQFDICGITTDATKFNTIVGNIESSVLTQVTDAVLHPPAQYKFENLKKAIIERYSDSEQSRMRKLLSDVDLGDKKPSQLFNELRQLAGEKIDSDFLKNIWLQRLPPQVQAILAAITGDAKTLANVADTIIDTGGYNRIQKISVTAGASSSKTPSSSIEAKIDELTQRFDRFERSRSQSRPRSKSSNRDSTPGVKTTLCWYHRRFGDRATRCNSDSCSFDSSKK